MKKILAALFLFATMFSCYNDENNYNYKDAGLLDVDSIVTSVYFPYGDIGVEYECSFDITDDILENYELMWEQGNTLLVAPEVYGYGSSFTFTPTTSGTYYFNLVATNKSTGCIAVSSLFYVYIPAVVESKSWLVIGEYNGKSGLSVIYPESEWGYNESGVLTYTRLDPTIIYNINTAIGDYNPSQLLYGIDKTDYYNTSGSSVSQYENAFLVRCDDGEGVFLNTEYPHMPVSVLSEDGIIDAPDDFELKEYFHGGGMSMMYDTQGRFYKKTKAVGAVYNYETPYYQTPLIYQGEEVKVISMLNNDIYCDHNLSPYYLLILVVETPDGTRKIICVDPEDKFVVVDYTAENTYSGQDASNLNFDDLQDWEMIYCMSSYYSVLQSFWKNSKTGETKSVYFTRYQTSGRNYNNYNTVDFPNSSVLDENSKFAIQYVASKFDYIFISHENKIYRYYFTTNLCEEWYDMPDGESITAISTNAQETELLIGCESGLIHAISIRDDVTYATNADKFLRTVGEFTRIMDIDYKYNDTVQLVYCTYNYKNSSSATYTD